MLPSTVDTSPIKKAELFSTLLEKEIESIISHSGLLQLRKGARLFSSGERATYFYILNKGSIRVFKPREDGDEDEMAHFTPGDTIGDFDFVRGATYDACAEAVEESELIMFPEYGLSLNIFAKEDPHVLCRILLKSIEMKTDRIKSTRKLYVENMSWVQEIHRRAYEDPGTGLLKQSFLTDECNRILEDPAALIMIKPDRFKILVDSRGHGAGDEAMVRIAMVLNNITRRTGRGWAIRFKSNEAGILVNKCPAPQAEKIAGELFKAIAALKPVPAQAGMEAFSFSASISWAVWPTDDSEWNSLFQYNYDLLMETWKAGGNRIVHYRKGGKP